MKVTTKGTLSASAYADRRLELDARQPQQLEEALDRVREAHREQYQSQCARLMARVPEQSKQRAEALYNAAKAAVAETESPPANEEEGGDAHDAEAGESPHVAQPATDSTSDAGAARTAWLNENPQETSGGVEIDRESGQKRRR